MLGISGTELLLILFFGFLIFGPEKLPQMGRTVGRAIRQFKTASDNMNKKFKEEVYDPFQEAVSPYKDAAEKEGAPLKDDIAAIGKNLKETGDMFKDPFRFDFGENTSSTPSTEKPAAKATSASSEPAVKKPLPDTGGTVKKGLAASLYDLDDSPKKGGE